MAKILAVDDDKAILTMIRRILEKDGHRVTVYADSGAVEQMELSGFDLILLDVMMPGTDGFTLCEKLRCRVDCPILFLTARSEESGGREESIFRGFPLKRHALIFPQSSCWWRKASCR